MKNKRTTLAIVSVLLLVAAIVTSWLNPFGEAGPSRAPKNADAALFVSGDWRVAEKSASAQAVDVLSNADSGPVRLVKVTREGSRPVVSVQFASSPTSAQSMVESWQDDADLLSVSVDTKVNVFADPYYDEQWAPAALNMENTWPRASGAGAIVAVIDTGVDSQHEDLVGQVLRGQNFTNDTSDTSDPNGHGTHVAGIIAAVKGNDVGVVGIAPAAKILPIVALDAKGSGWNSDIAKAIIYAVDNGADVINLSFGGPTSDQSTKTAIEYAVQNNVVVVAAAGNNKERGNPTTYPAAYPGVIAVASVDSAKKASAFSNTGEYVDISAPGSFIYNTLPGNQYENKSGTSMAAPHIAAVAALARDAKDADINPEMFYQALTSSSIDLGDAGWDEIYGYGFVDPYKVVCTFMVCGTPDVSQEPKTATKISFTTAGGTVFEGEKRDVSLQLVDAQTDKPIAHAPVKIVARMATGKVRKVKTVTDNAGVAAVQFKLWVNTTFTAKVKNTQTLSASKTNKTLLWQTVPRVSVSYSDDRATAKFDRAGNHTVQYQKFTDNTWRTVHVVAPRKKTAKVSGLTTGVWRVLVPATESQAAIVSGDWQVP